MVILERVFFVCNNREHDLRYFEMTCGILYLAREKQDYMADYYWAVTTTVSLHYHRETKKSDRFHIRSSVCVRVLSREQDKKRK